MHFLTFLAFTAAVAIVTYIYSKGNDETSAGYFLGGRSLTAGVIAGSLLLTNLSTEQIVGLNGQSYSEGILVMAWETLAAIAMVVTALFLLPRYLQSGLTTIPEFLEIRYDRSIRTMANLLFLSGYAIIFLPIVLYSGSLALMTIFDIPGLTGWSHMASLFLCVLGIGILGSIYAIFGGLKAVAVSDTVNGIGLLIGGLLIPYFGLKYIGSDSALEGLSSLWQNHPEKFIAKGNSDSSIPFATIFTGMMLVQLFYWGTNQAIIQRALAAKNLEEGQKGLLLAAFFKILGPVIVVLPGIIAFEIFQGNLEIPDQAYPLLVSKVLPAGLLGFFAAVLFGAILSSFNSALNSSVTLFGLGIYRPYLHPTSSDQEVISAGKKFGIALALVAIIVAPLISYAPDGLFGYLQEVNGCYSIPILTIIVIGYLFKRVPPIAAKIGLISGVVLYSISQFIVKPYFFPETYPHFLHIMAILFVVNSLIMIAIGRWYPLDSEFELEESDVVGLKPFKYVLPMGIGVVVVVILTYIIFQ